MPAALGFELNLNQLSKDILSKFKDAFDQDEDLCWLERKFRRQFRLTQALQKLLQDDTIEGVDVFEDMSETQRASLAASIEDAEVYWQLFGHLLGRFNPGNGSNASDDAAQPIPRAGQWASRDIIKAEEVLARAERVNKDIKDDIDIFIANFTQNSPDSTEALQNNSVLKEIGISQNIALRRTARRTIDLDKKLLKSHDKFEPASVRSQLNPDSSLRKGVYAEKRNVLIEHRYYPANEEDVEHYALQLATFLKLEKPANMKVLPCLATYHHEPSGSYGIVYDISPLNPENSTVSDSTKTSLEKAIPNFANLKSQLLRSTKGGIFRYSTFGSDTTFPSNRVRPLSSTERLRFASSLSQTVYQVLLADWVHQDIRSDHVWFTINEKPPSKESDQILTGRERFPNAPYLFHFEFARVGEKDYDPSAEQGQDEYINLTRHPSRQYGNVLARHSKIHDIYSLGVVLLEIGMGRPIDELYTVFRKISLEGKTPIQQYQQEHIDKDAGSRIHRILLGAAALLPERMGDRYFAVVKRCLLGEFMDQEEANGTAEGSKAHGDLLQTFRKAVIEELISLTSNSRDPD